MNIDKWLKNNTKDLTGKVVAISGSTGGLGEQLCFQLAKLGSDLIFLNRNEEKSKALIDKLKAKFPNIKINVIQTDMEDIESVKEGCQQLKRYNIDFLVLNAGAYKIPRKRVGQFDNIFQINFISPYFLACEMLSVYPKLKIVAVGSIAHKGVKLNKKDLALLNCKKDMKVYGNSKRFLMFALSEKVTNCGQLSLVHPGITYTNITSHYPKIFMPFIKFFMKILFNSNKVASLNIVKGMFTNCRQGQWIGPRIFDIWGKPKEKRLKSLKKEESKEIFQVAEEIYTNLKKEEK